ncbi:hypothetical protein XF24_00146 [candidate division SR1 bacterium Aalborg_AAW-1]|nr:hypothetical protein XF24_00146 [candidate division SR1 bacterium Aalborg_AAW-1]
MYFNRYKFTRTSEHFKVEDKKTKEEGTLPLLFKDLSEIQQKKCKNYLRGTKILSPIAIGLIFLMYKHYKRFLILLGFAIIPGIIASFLDPSIGEMISTIGGLLYIIVWLYCVVDFIRFGVRDSYENGAYYLLKKAYENI